MSALSYSTELYDAIADFGLRRNAQVLDIACGDGAAASPFVQAGFPVTGIDVSDRAVAAARARVPQAQYVQGRAEDLPFPDERFEATLIAQSIQLLDRPQALQEAFRVLRPGGVVAVWWKQLMAQEGVREIREDAFREFGIEAPADGPSGGFKEFYAAEYFRDQTLRVLPWRSAMPLSRFLEKERSEQTIQDAMGSRLSMYLSVLERRIRARLSEAGDPTLTLAYVQYLYMAKKP